MSIRSSTSSRFERAARITPIYADVVVGGLKLRKLVNYKDLFVIDRELGHGAFSTVWLAYDQRNNRPVTLKIMNIDLTQETGGDELSATFDELEILRALTKDIPIGGIPKLYGSFVASNTATSLELAIVLEYIDGENLEKLIGEMSAPPNNVYLRGFTTWLFTILAKLHGHRLVHRDIKPANIMVTKDGRFYLVDLGFACSSTYGRADYHVCDISGFTGTKLYAAPELLTGSISSPDMLFAADIWAAGMTLLELMTLRRFYEGNDIGQLLAKIEQGIYVPESPPTDAIVTGCLRYDPVLRPSAVKIMDVLEKYLIKIGSY